MAENGDTNEGKPAWGKLVRVCTGLMPALTALSKTCTQDSKIYGSNRFHIPWIQ